MNSQNTTSLSKRILGKDLNDLTYEDIESFFKEEKEETENLEFKSGNGGFDANFTKNIIRTIAAFLNSSGGILIWGAPTDKKVEKANPKVCIGNLTPLNESKDKDQLINRISSSISYMPTGVNLVKLEKNEKYIYVFEVKESASKPHQYNGIYYVRLDGQSKPGPHYLVDALFKQVKFADLEAHIKWISITTSNTNNYEIKFEVLLFNLSPLKLAIKPKFYLTINPGIFKQNKDRMIYSNSYEYLVYGPPLSSIIEIKIDTLNLLIHDARLTLNVFNVSENSPLKSSEYTINLTDFLDGNKPQLSQIVHEKYKNRYLHELHLENKTSKDEFIQQMINLGAE